MATIPMQNLNQRKLDSILGDRMLSPREKIERIEEYFSITSMRRDDKSGDLEIRMILRSKGEAERKDQAFVESYALRGAPI
jgi:hypothetical protein